MRCMVPLNIFKLSLTSSISANILKVFQSYFFIFIMENHLSCITTQGSLSSRDRNTFSSVTKYDMQMWQTHLGLDAILEELKGKGLSHGCIYQYAFKPMSGSSNTQSEQELNVIKITVSTDEAGYNLYSL